MSVASVDVNAILTQYPSNKIPSISSETINFIRTKDIKLSYTVASIKGKVSNLEQIRAKLLNHPHPTGKDKMISLMAMIFALSILASGVLGTYYGCKAGTTFGSIIAGILPILTLIIFGGVGAWYNHKWSIDGNGVIRCRQGSPAVYGTALFVFFIGPFIPVYRTFCDGSGHNQTVQQEHATEIQALIDRFKAFFKENDAAATDIISRLIQHPPKEMPENAIGEFQAIHQFYTERT